MTCVHCFDTTASTSFSQFCPLPHFPLSPPKSRSQYFQHISFGFIPLEPLFTLFLWAVFKNRDLPALLRCLKTCTGSCRLRGKSNEALRYHPAPSSLRKASCPTHAECPHTPGHLHHLGGSLFTTQVTAPLLEPSCTVLCAPLVPFRSLSCHSHFVPLPDRELLQDRDLSYPPRIPGP